MNPTTERRKWVRRIELTGAGLVIAFAAVGARSVTVELRARPHAREHVREEARSWCETILHESATPDRPALERIRETDPEWLLKACAYTIDERGTTNTPVRP